MIGEVIVRVVEDAVGAVHGLVGAEGPVPLPAKDSARSIGGILAGRRVLRLPEMDRTVAIPAGSFGHHPHGDADGASGRLLADEDLLATEVSVSRVVTGREQLLADEPRPLQVPLPTATAASLGVGLVGQVGYSENGPAV